MWAYTAVNHRVVVNMASESIMAEELGERTKQELTAEARNAGVYDDAIGDTGEGEDEKAALIELIVAASARPAAAQKRAALAEKSKKELKAEARQAGVSTDAIDDAGQAEDEKAALIDLILTAGATEERTAFVNTRDDLGRTALYEVCRCDEQAGGPD